MVVITLVIQLTLGLVVFLYQASALNRLLDTGLRERSEPLAATLEDTDVSVVLPQLDTLAEQRLAFGPNESRRYALFDARGNLIGGSPTHGIPDNLIPLITTRSTRSGVVFRREGSIAPGAAPIPLRIISRGFIDSTHAQYFLVVVRDDQMFETMIALIRRVLILTVPVGIIGAGVAGWLISGLALAPVRRLRAVADTLAPEAIEQAADVDLGVAELQGVQVVLEEVRDRIRTAFVARDRFIANISHELKTPIAVILTEAQTLDARGLTSEARAFVRSVIDETRRLNRTIESFLTVTKIRAGKSLMEHAPCSVSDFVMDAVLGCTRMARQQQVTINPLLADAEQARQIVGDCELLRVMVENLLRNAIRSSPPEAQVLVHVTESAAEFVIAVRDFGSAVPSGPLPASPDPTQSDDASGPRGITVGLSIAQTIAELHAGQITANNIASGGCEFVVRLPSEPVSNGAHASTAGAGRAAEER
jgi:signal transduction histidine kinase